MRLWLNHINQMTCPKLSNFTTDLHQINDVTNLAESQAWFTCMKPRLIHTSQFWPPKSLQPKPLWLNSFQPWDWLWPWCGSEGWTADRPAHRGCGVACRRWASAPSRRRWGGPPYSGAGSPGSTPARAVLHTPEKEEGTSEGGGCCVLDMVDNKVIMHLMIEEYYGRLLTCKSKHY